MALGEYTLELPCGLVEEDGSINRSAVITEMTGATQALIGRRDLIKDPELLVKAVLRSCVIKYAGRDMSDNIYGDMLLGDREFLLMEIRRKSMGDTIRTSFECGSCGTASDLEADLGAMDIYELVDPGTTGCPYVVESLPDGRSHRIWEAENSDLGLKIRSKYSTCRNIAQNKDTNSILMAHRVLGSNIVEWQEGFGETLNVIEGPFPSKFISDQPLRVVDWLMNVASLQGGGPDMTQEIACPACSSTIEVRVDMSDFFLPTPTSKGSRSASIRLSGQ